MKRNSLAILLSTSMVAAALLGGCASAGYNPNATEPSWSKSMNSMGNDVSNSITPEEAQKASDETNKAANSASDVASPNTAQKASDEANKAGAQADSSLYHKNDQKAAPTKKAPAKSGTAAPKKGK